MPVRRVGRPSPWGAFLRGANLFARAPCREAFVEGSVLARDKSFRSCAVSGGLRRGERSRVGQIFSLVRRVGRPSPWGAFLRAGKSFRSCAVSGGLRRGACSCAGQILSLVRRVGRLSPRRAFLRGANSFARAPCREAFAEESVPARANPFARAPCREAFAEGAFLRGANPAHHSAPCREAFAVGSVLARGKFFCSCAVSGGFRRGERFCAGQILSLVRRVGKPSPRRAFLRGQIFSLVRRVGRPSPRSVFLRG